MFQNWSKNPLKFIKNGPQAIKEARQIKKKHQKSSKKGRGWLARRNAQTDGEDMEGWKRLQDRPKHAKGQWWQKWFQKMKPRTWKFLRALRAPIQHAAPRGSADRSAHSAGLGSWFVIRCLEEVENKTIWIVKVGDFATIGTNSCKKMRGKGVQNYPKNAQKCFKIGVKIL